MDIPDMLRALDAQIAQLQQVRQLLSDSASASSSLAGPAKRRGRPPADVKPVPAKAAGKRMMSEEGKARIAAAQKKRWAKSKKAAKVASTPSVVVAKKSALPTKKAVAKKGAQAAASVKAAAKKMAAPTKKTPVKKTVPRENSIADAPRLIERTEPEQNTDMPATTEEAAAEA